MTPDSLLYEFENLPSEAQSQVVDFLVFIKARYQKKQVEKIEPEDNYGFGSIKVTKNISLDEMDDAIAQGACSHDCHRYQCTGESFNQRY